MKVSGGVALFELVNRSASLVHGVLETMDEDDIKTLEGALQKDDAADVTPVIPEFLDEDNMEDIDLQDLVARQISSDIRDGSLDISMISEPDREDITQRIGSHMGLAPASFSTDM